MSGPVWRHVIGQPEAVRLLQAATDDPVHAYLFLGPPGSGKRDAARTFAAALLCRAGQCGVCRDCTLALAGHHPDVSEFYRAGAAISTEQADEIVRRAALSPVEGDRKVMILDEFHLLQPPVAAKLLKTIEEPPPSTVFLVLADQLVLDLVTIASRCVRVSFRPLGVDDIAQVLRDEGVDADAALAAADAASGDLSRARLLATDPGLAARRAAFASVPTQLDGNGATVAKLTDELLAMIDAAAEPLKARHRDELTALEERVAQTGERGAGRKTMEERHRRELRRHRMDELRFGLATVAGRYRDHLATTSGGRRGLDEIAAVGRIHEALETLERNPNESLLLQALLLGLPPVR
jgi:DNA polymerase-3 subunit delta'